MENSEKIKIIQYHNNLQGFDCPCVLRATGKFEVHAPDRMPKDEAELELWKMEMIADLESKEYLTLRVYPSIGDQLDYIFHNGVEAWKTDMIQPVKDKYKKPNLE